jgi:outer membrane immunogenic protein
VVADRRRLFADFDFSSWPSKWSQVLPAPQNTGSGKFKRDRGWSIGGRLGWLTSPGTLLYIPFGFTQAHYTWDGFYFSSDAADTTYSKTTNGWFVGFGIETQLVGNLSLRGEYRYASLTGFCAGSSPTQTTSICAGTDNHVGFSVPLGDIVEQSGRATLAYKFGQSWPRGRSDAGFGNPQPALNWTGLYVGAGIGYGSVAFTPTLYNDDGSFNDAFENGGHGGLITGVVGYDYQFWRRFVAGVFADYDFSSIAYKWSCGTLCTVMPASGRFERDRNWSVGGRLGWLATPRTLLYVPFGFTQSHYRWDGIIFSWDNSDTTYSKTSNGWFVGAGLETQLIGNFSLRAEYRYASLANFCIGSSATQTVGMCAGTDNRLGFPANVQDIVEQTGRVTLDYKFR